MLPRYKLPLSYTCCNILIIVRYFVFEALTHLDKIKVWGKQIRVAPSKHPIVQMPTDLQADGAKLTKDYTNSPLHRYKKKGSKNYQNIYPPSATLHLSNIPYVTLPYTRLTLSFLHNLCDCILFSMKGHSIA